MPAAIRMRSDLSAGELRRLAAMTKNANQSRPLLSLAAILDGMSRTEAARIGGMDRQTVRDWVHRFNERGPEGLKDIRSKGHPPRLSPAQQAELAHLVEIGPDRAVHGVVRWRRIDLKQLIAERFGVTYHERTVGQILHQLGFSPISARPRHPAQDERVMAEFKKPSRYTERPFGWPRQGQAGRDLVRDAMRRPPGIMAASHSRRAPRCSPCRPRPQASSTSRSNLERWIFIRTHIRRR